MNLRPTEIAFVPGRFGSMKPIAANAVAGPNAFLREPQSAPGRVRFTLAPFDDRHEVPTAVLPVVEVVFPAKGRTYVPRGSIALLDAIGRTADDPDAHLAATP